MRAHNFSAGPAALPTEVLEKAQSELLDYQNTGSSIMEMSHRGPHFTEVINSAKNRLKRLLNLPSDYHVIFLQGGATHQFAMLPMNFLSKNDCADFINTGIWSKKAIKEAKRFGNIHVSFNGEDDAFKRIPTNEEISIDSKSKFVHFTSNNTIYGTQFVTEPISDGKLLVCDASSDFLSRPIDIERYGLIYAGAQKNLGPSGCAVVIIKEDYLTSTKNHNLPDYLRYETHVERLFHTPPTFTIYLIDLVLEWLEGLGGVQSIYEINQKKAQLLYSELDKDDFYLGYAQNDSRSQMNALFRIKDEKLENTFLELASKQNLIGLKAHRTTGGIRVSLYNAISLDSVQKLVNFMADFRNSKG